MANKKYKVNSSILSAITKSNIKVQDGYECFNCSNSDSKNGKCKGCVLEDDGIPSEWRASYTVIGNSKEW
jgi:hypothetical protein